MSEIHAWEISIVDKKGKRFFNRKEEDEKDEKLLRKLFENLPMSGYLPYLKRTLEYNGFSIERERNYQLIVKKNGQYFKMRATY